MNRQKIAAVLVFTLAASCGVPAVVHAAVNFDLRKKVIGVAGIMNVTNTDAMVTRAEFARMLVYASSHRSTVSQAGSTSVFADVEKNNEYASYIRIAASEGWMNGYLGGNFKPDQYITLSEAARGILALLGYSNEDFAGDQAGGRMAKYRYLELDDEINKEDQELLDKEDCIHLFYNLLKTNKKDGSGHYGKVLGCELTSDGEINPLTLADNSLKGPKVIRNGRRLSDYVPFSLSRANAYLNGEATSIENLKNTIESEAYVLIYYHSGTKTIWAYSESGDQAGRAVVQGEITNIYYSSADVMTPSAVVLNGNMGEPYLLSSSEMQFAFSMYGSMRVGDSITLVYERAEKADGTVTDTVVDYLED